MTRSLSAEQLEQLRDLCRALTTHHRRQRRDHPTPSASSSSAPAPATRPRRACSPTASPRRASTSCARRARPRRSSVIELGPLAVDTARAAVAGFPGEALQAAIDRLAAADAIIAATPVYKAGISGLFKSFVDVLDNDLLVAKPVAARRDRRHAAPRAGHRRPDAPAVRLHARAHAADLGVRRARGLGRRRRSATRIERAATELAVWCAAGVEQQIADRAWSGYQHQFAGNATRAERTAADVDFDSPLMRLAAGGR